MTTMGEFRGFVAAELAKMAVKSALTAAIVGVAVLVTPLWTQIKRPWVVADHFEAFVEQQTERDAQLLDELKQLRAAVDRATGDDKVLRMTAGMSYVEEPYRIGQSRPLRLNLFAQRTTLGAGCRFIGGASIFTDENGVALAGSRIEPKRNVGSMPERIVLDLTPPALMRPGRTVLELDLEYECGGITTFNRTDPVIFYAWPAEGN
jgi:hypothetical protein